MRRATSIVLMLMLAAAVPASAQDAVKAPRLESLLPAETFFVVGAADLPAACQQLSGSALGKLWAEPEVRQFIGPALEFARSHIARASREAGVPIGDVLRMFAGQAKLAVVEFDPLYGGMIPDAVFYLDLGSRRADFHALVMRLLDQAGDHVGVREEQAGDFRYHILTLPMGVELALGYIGDAACLTTFPERLLAMVEASRNGLESNLGTNPTFRTAHAKTGGEGQFFHLFVNAEAVLNHFADRLDPMIADALHNLGLDAVKAIAMGSKFHAEGILDTFFLGAPGEKRGLMKLAYTAPGTADAMLSRIPKEAFLAQGGRFDAAEFLEIVLDLVHLMNPYAAEEAEGMLAQAGEMLGLDVRKDLLEPLGEEVGFYAAPPAGGGLIPDAVLLWRLDDPERFGAALEKLVARAWELADRPRGYEMEHRRMEFAGKTIHYVHVAGNPGRDPFPVTPSFVIDGNLLAVALFPQPLKHFLAREGGSLADRPDFQRVMKGLPKDLSYLEYVDLAAGLRIVYGSLVPMAQAAGKFRGVPLDPALLPRTETLAKHLFGAAWGSKAAEDGITAYAYSQVGIVPMTIGMVAPLVVLAAGQTYRAAPRPAEPVERAPATAPEGREPRPPAPPAAAGMTPEDRLKEVYVALLYHFADPAASSYPATLGELVASKALADGSALVLPGDGGPVDAGGGVKSSFLYTGPKAGMLMEGSDSAVWVYEHVAREGARWVLFANGGVRRVPEAEFQKLLAGTKAMLAR